MAARPCRHAVGERWHVDETYLKVAGNWRYVYRAIDQFGHVVDVFLSNHRDARAARQFFERAIAVTQSEPAEVVIDRARAYLGVLDELFPAALHDVERYANNLLEADHGRLNSRLRPMRGLKAVASAQFSAVVTRSSRTSGAATTSLPWMFRRADGWPGRSPSSPWRSDESARPGSDRGPRSNNATAPEHDRSSGRSPSGWRGGGPLRAVAGWHHYVDSPFTHMEDHRWPFPRCWGMAPIGT